MSETQTGLLPWPQDAEAFVAEAKKNGKVAYWNRDLQKFVKESTTGKGDTLEVVYSDPDPTDPIFFGLPNASPYGLPQVVSDGDKRQVVYHPIESIEGVKVRHLYADLTTGCGVYLRLDAYDPTGREDKSDAAGKATKKILGVAK